ncbi:MAG: DUF3800 domain-containing protein [Bryobacteraceae bacterium]
MGNYPLTTSRPEDQTGVSGSEVSAYIPIRSLSAFSAPGQRSIAIVLKGYLDGSGKCEDPASRLLTLAGIFADESIWGVIEPRWDAVLQKHGTPYSHMKELLRNDGPFVGWEEKRKRDFVRDLFDCLSVEDRSSFIAASLTIDLAGYRKVANGNRTAKPAPAVCVDFCMTHAFAHRDFSKRRSEIFFDRGESFIKFLERIWSRKKADASSWASYVATLNTADMSQVLPIQIADLLAWGANRFHQSDEQDDWWFSQWRSIFALDHYHEFYGEQELIRHPGFFKWKKKLPE